MDVLSRNLESVTDPTDWTNTKFPNFQNFDSMIRCHICKEFMRAPVITNCDHCFCSSCIRKYLNTNSKCPLCNEKQFESGLRKVLLLDEIIIWFSKNRSDLFKILQNDTHNDQDVDDTNNEENVITIRNGSSNDDSSNYFKNKSNKRGKLFDSLNGNNKKRKNEDDKKPFIYESMKKKKIKGFNSDGTSNTSSSSNTTTDKPMELVECPICSEFMTVDELQTNHIDKCLTNVSTNDSQSRTKTQTQTQRDTRSSPIPRSEPHDKSGLKRSETDPSDHSNHRKINNEKDTKMYQIQSQKFANKKRLPKLDFPSISLTRLKETLSNLGIQTNGNRSILEMRYTEFVNLYNSNLDSVSPVSDTTLLGRLRKWESLGKIENNTNTTSNSNNNHISGDPSVERKKKNLKERKKWNNKYKSEYQDLIAKAKASILKNKERIVGEDVKTDVKTEGSDDIVEVIELDVTKTEEPSKLQEQQQQQKQGKDNDKISHGSLFASENYDSEVASFESIDEDALTDNFNKSKQGSQDQNFNPNFSENTVEDKLFVDSEILEH